jgi:hypothetical protein
MKLIVSLELPMVASEVGFRVEELLRSDVSGSSKFEYILYIVVYVLAACAQIDGIQWCIIQYHQ